MLGLTRTCGHHRRYDIHPGCLARNAAAFAAAAKAKDKTVHALIAVDTGMGRIGYLADDLDFAVEDVKKIAALENFKIKGMFSHMSTADAAFDKTLFPSAGGKIQQVL